MMSPCHTCFTLSDVLFQQVSALGSNDIRYGRGYVCYGGSVREQTGDLGNLTRVDGDSRTLREVGLQVLRNPSAGGVKVQWEVSAATKVRIEVFDVAGRRLGTVFEGQERPGVFHAEWPGKQQRALANGIYFVRMEAGRDVRRARVVVIK